MVPPVRFLEQLMPAAHHGGAFVRAALPSRFAPQALEIESRESLALLPSADDSNVVSPEDTRAVPLHQLEAPRDEPPRSTRPSSPTPSAARTLDHAAVVVDATPVRVKSEIPPRRTDSPATTTPVSSHESSRTPPPIVERHTAGDVSAVPREREHATSRSASPFVLAPRASSKAPANATARPPLREHVREQRIASPVEPPTIVQVTIDRIDVRAPAANATPERTAPKPRNASWKSLGDYLRQRDGAGGGAP